MISYGEESLPCSRFIRCEFKRNNYIKLILGVKEVFFHNSSFTNCNYIKNVIRIF